MTKSTAIVTTTIYVPKLLESYAADAKEHERDPLFVIVGDKKTPPETEHFCADLAKQTGSRVEYLSPERQEEYLSKFPALKEHLPWNSIQRRNAGLLFAYESGCENIITIDDDNLRETDDYIGAHAAGSSRTLPMVSSSTGWLNVCALLEEAHGRDFYHRGFPLEKKVPETWTRKEKEVRIAVSAGLWLEDPDVDAMERLYWLSDPTDAVRFRGENIAIAAGTWTPFNSQNTALMRDCIPAYFLSPHIGRYDDIWASYIVKRIADHLGDSIAFGEPIVRQKRNPHDYWKDLDAERMGHALTLRFVSALAALSLEEKTYAECYAEIANMLPRALEGQNMNEAEQRFVRKLFEGMAIWRDTFRSLS